MMYLHNVPRPVETPLVPTDGLPSSSSSSATGTGNVPTVDRHEWCEFQHKPGFRIYNFDEVKQELIREMERIAGRNKGISAEPICLTIHSPRVPDLVIIDLPGITKVPVGDQPADIELQIRKLCLYYMSQQNNIILAVHPANQDLANSDALKLAMEADPEGERTIGVLTKIDLMDPGTDARDVLSGRVVPLRRGFVPVVCRSQKDIQDSMLIQDGLTRERAFFERHYAYRAMASRCGTAYLTRVLSHMLFTAIRAHLPAIRSQLSLAAQSYEQQLRELGDPVEAADSKEQGHLLLKLLSRFANNFCDMIEGRVHADAGSDLLIDELFGGARIQEVVRTRFNQWTSEWEALMDSQLRDDEILMATRNSAGPRSALFIPEQAFISLVRRQIIQLKDLGRRFADEIYDELRRIAERCEPPQLYRFGELREKAVEVVQNLLRRAFLPTVDMIDRLIDIELAHINTTHPDFVGAARALEYVLLEDRNAPLERMVNEENNHADPRNSDDYNNHSKPNGLSDENNDDVVWAMNRLGANPSRHPSKASKNHDNGDLFNVLGGGNSRSKGILGNHGKSSSFVTGVNGKANDDIRSRFGPRVVHEMLGDDNLLLGAVKRVGGPNSPFVELPRPSPLVKATNGNGIGNGYAIGISGSSIPVNTNNNIVYPGSPMVQFTNSANHRWATPGGVNGVTTLPINNGNNNNGNNEHTSNVSSAASGNGANLPTNGASNGTNNAYHGMSLLVVPQKPLPEVITPDDLRADDKERREIRVIRVLLQSYLSIVKKNYTDMVPKTVMCMLVNRVKDEIASELVHHLYTQITSVDALLRETDDVAGRRRELVDQLTILNKGINILNEIRDSGITNAPPNANIPVPSGNNPNHNNTNNAMNIMMGSSYTFPSASGTGTNSPTHMNHYTSGGQHIVRAPIAVHYPHQPSTNHTTVQGSSPGGGISTNLETSSYLSNGVGGSGPSRRSLGGEKNVLQNSNNVANMMGISNNNNNGFVKTVLPQLSNSTNLSA